MPGGIVRYKEPMLQRLERVAQVEIGRPVGYDPRPLAVNELIIEQKVRGHFISFLHRCTLPRGFAPDNGDLGAGDVGYLRWHAGCPDDLLRVQELYRAYIDDATGYGVNEEGRQ